MKVGVIIPGGVGIGKSEFIKALSSIRENGIDDVEVIITDSLPPTVSPQKKHDDEIDAFCAGLSMVQQNPTLLPPSIQDKTIEINQEEKEMPKLDFYDIKRLMRNTGMDGVAYPSKKASNSSTRPKKTRRRRGHVKR